MSDPLSRPGNDDPGIEHATDAVVEGWRGAGDGKEPTVASEDFTDAATREQQLAHSDPATPGQTAASRATSESGPDA
jgi:hypothetical protein